MRQLIRQEKDLFKKAAGRPAPKAWVQIWTWWANGFNGIAIGPLILIKDRDVIYHELVHVIQFYSNPSTFWFRYLYYLVRDGYRNNPYEIEAREIQRRCNDRQSL